MDAPLKRRDAIADIWGQRTPFVGEWPERVDEHTVAEPERGVQSACVLCANGCGMDIGIRDGRIVGVRGRAIDRVNHGRLGPKGLYGWQANNSPDRLTTPLIRRDGKLVEATWDEAMEFVATRSKELKEKYGSGSLAVYNTGVHERDGRVCGRRISGGDLARRSRAARSRGAGAAGRHRSRDGLHVTPRARGPDRAWHA